MTTSATAQVTVSMTVEITQPWGPEAPLDAVAKVAREEAMDRIMAHCEALSRSGIRVGPIAVVRIIISEET